MIGVVGMKALHSPGRSGDAPGGPVNGPARHQLVTVAAVTLVGLLKSRREFWIAVDSGLHLLDGTGRLQPGDSPHRQRTRQPEPGREGSAIIEQWRHRHHYRQAQRTSSHYIGTGPQGSSDLGGNDVSINRQRDRRR